MSAPTRMQTFPCGITGVDIATIEREIPSSEPPTLPVNELLDTVGQRRPRIDGRAKVTGAARYTVDVKLPGMLFARILRSPHAHARVIAVETESAARHPGVKAVHVVSEPGGREVQTVRYAGAAVAAVAATTRAAAEEALALIRADYEPLPFVVDMDEARQAYAPAVFESVPEHGTAQSANVWGPATDAFGASNRGDVTQGFGAADVIIEDEFRTEVQTHCCLEAHAIVADWQAERLTVYTSTQNVIGVRDEIAAAFNLDPAKVRVISEFMGGGFGSKLSAGDFSFIAVALSRAAGLPVALTLDRREEQLAAGNRPATWQRLRLGARPDGTLTAISVLSYGTAGIAINASVGNIAGNLYTCPNFEMTQYDVMTNGGPGCAMRAPGNVQGAFGLEQIIDTLAERLGLDPIALRDRIDPSAARREERRIGAERIGWNRRHKPGTEAGSLKRGIGMAQSYWPSIVDTSSACEIRIGRDGGVELRSGVQDIGTGTRTVLAQVVAEELGLSLDDVAVRIGDSDFPRGQSSGGSKMTGSITPAARNAAYEAGRALRATVAAAFDRSADAFAMKGGRVFDRTDPTKGFGFRAATALLTDDIRVIAGRPGDYGGFGVARSGGGMARSELGGVQFVAVAVDTETGSIRVERVVAVHDCGRPINPMLIESQIHGGILMGISYALFENRLMDRNSGHMLNPDLENYKLLGPGDVPTIEVALLENYHGCSATDACGIAEPATIPTAAAIANAVYNATGARLRSLPMAPATVLAALGKIPDTEWRL